MQGQFEPSRPEFLMLLISLNSEHWRRDGSQIHTGDNANVVVGAAACSLSQISACY